MGDSAVPRPLTGWQRTHVLAAAEYMREILLRTPGDAKARAVYDGLLDLLEPTRRGAREGSDSSGGPAAFELRADKDRRSGTDRRRANAGPPAGVERRRRERRVADRRR
ncbi:MAG TPA: hypothetical protein VGQ10_11950 [Vicinamibacterales bacterium]|nr:hypothetical protein [Vicinamibacterales bacterium]